MWEKYKRILFSLQIIGSFFASYSSAASLSRTSVFVNVGGRTQVLKFSYNFIIFIFLL
jgi:MFS superfamily sulfate permease-like transporter